MTTRRLFLQSLLALAAAPAAVLAAPAVPRTITIRLSDPPRYSAEQVREVVTAILRADSKAKTGQKLMNTYLRESKKHGR